MKQLTEKICLVVPCYNEEKRLKIQEFTSFDPNCYFIFVNDGSTDGTLKLIQENLRPGLFCLNLEQNSGKAEAIRQGILFLKGLPVFPEIQWAGYWDADLSTPLAELYDYLLFYQTFAPSAQAIWGSRVRRLGSDIKRSFKRHFLGRFFANITSLVLGLRCYDSQCGAKLFKKELLEPAFGEKFISRWIFDVELMLRLDKYSIVEYPLKHWHDVGGSKVKLFSVAYRTLMEIFRIRDKYVRQQRKR
ncbi:MAG: glycosyltransferase [Firmicutes bacterium]|nr:glycosyltransferase [Bacillota bacterium]